MTFQDHRRLSLAYIGIFPRRHDWITRRQDQISFPWVVVMTDGSIVKEDVDAFSLGIKRRDRQGDEDWIFGSIERSLGIGNGAPASTCRTNESYIHAGWKGLIARLQICSTFNGAAPQVSTHAPFSLPTFATPSHTP